MSMRRAAQQLGLSGLLLTGLLSTQAFAQSPRDADDPSGPNADAQPSSEQPNAAAQPAAAALPVVPVAAAPIPVPKPRPGDVSVSGYLRAGFGASNQKGRMTCFKLGNIPGGLFSKYRLGNECEVWSETHFTIVTYVGDDGSIGTLHVMPTIYLPTTYIGNSPNGAVTAPDQNLTSTGAVLYVPNLYADLQGIPWLHGGTAWIGTRYYKRESVYISDFFYWNPSGVGAGIEDVNLGRDLRLSYAAFAVDGEPVSSGASSPSLPAQIDFGVRNDVQLRGIRPWRSGEFQVGFQYIANFSNNPASHGGWGATLQWVQQVPGGDNKVAVQYGRGGGTGFGTLARFYYPDFSVRHDLGESRIRLVEVLTIQPTAWLGQQAAFVFQRDDMGTLNSQIDWYSAGTRLGLAFTRHAKLLGEVGYDRVVKSNGAAPQYLAKVTGAVALTPDRGFMARPELRLFYTWARWNDAARTAGVDSGRIYTDVYTGVLTGSIFGLQAETVW